MQSPLYYLAAVIAAIAVIAFALNILREGQEGAVNSTQIVRAKKQLFTAVPMIERDFRNLGAGVDSVEKVFPAGLIDTTSCKSPGGECRFTFNGRVDSTNMTVSRISYRWVYSGSEVITDQETKAEVTVPLFRLRRGVDGDENTLKWDRVTDFHITLFDSTGSAISGNAENTRQIHVELQALVPRGIGNDLEVMRWASWFRPVNLTRW